MPRSENLRSAALSSRGCLQSSQQWKNPITRKTQRVAAAAAAGILVWERHATVAA
jgi:hypothetical protein